MMANATQFKPIKKKKRKVTIVDSDDEEETSSKSPTRTLKDAHRRMKKRVIQCANFLAECLSIRKRKMIDIRQRSV